MLFRVALRDFDLAGYTVPQGKQLLLPLKYLSAQDSRWSKKTGDVSPDAFVPERMLTPEGQKAGDLMPFGHGARWDMQRQ
jgi:cytochrome P450